MRDRVVELTGDRLSVEEVVAVARGRARVAISGDALRRVRVARGVVEAVLASAEPVYGLNTGLGSFARYRGTVSPRPGAFREARVLPPSGGR